MKTHVLTHYKQLNRLLLFIIISQYSYTQETNPPLCNLVTGNALHEHIQCDNFLTITSTINEGANGTDITGLYFSDVGVHIVPGYTQVRILPELGGRTLLEHRTRVGNNTGSGNGSGSAPPKHQANNNLVVFPNPSTNNLSLLNFKDQAKSFEILDSRGNLLKQDTISNLKNYSISTKTLKPSTYILNITLKTGEVITKLFIKQ